MMRLALPPGPLDLLCLGAHSDDIEIGAGGTVLRLLEEHPGSRVHWVVFSAAGERKTEAEASAAEFLKRAAQVQIVCHVFRDGYFPFEGAAIKDEFERLKSRIHPALILTHYKGDAHQDHRLVADLTYNTWRYHLILEYEVPKMEGDIGNPAVFVPLTRAQADTKVAELMRHFSSQRSRAWFAEDTFMALMRLRGINAGASEGLAEAFHCRRVCL